MAVSRTKEVKAQLTIRVIIIFVHDDCETCWRGWSVTSLCSIVRGSYVACSTGVNALLVINVAVTYPQWLRDVLGEV